jgi:DEAD/DEAH box helicase domain-containing protein
VLVPSGAPVDQFVARESTYLTGTPIEEARIDPDNVDVLLQHLRCAAFELPFVRGESFGAIAAEITAEALGLLVDEGVVHASASRWHWVAAQYPAQGISLRTAGRERFLVVDVERDVTLAEVDPRSARLQLHPGAIYQHEGSTWIVESLDEAAHKALVRPSPHDWFTEALTRDEVTVVETSQEAPLRDDPTAIPIPCGLGEVQVTTRLVGLKKVRFHTHENLGYGELESSPIDMFTSAFWIVVSDDIITSLAEGTDDDENPVGRTRALDGLRGVASSLRTILSLALMCAPQDLGATLGGRVDDETPSREGPIGPGVAPTIFLYDAVAGGVGLAERAFERRDELAARALGSVLSCPCADGCPACVSPGLDTGSASRKRIAVEIFRAMGVTAPM